MHGKETVNNNCPNENRPSNGNHTIVGLNEVKSKAILVCDFISVRVLISGRGATIKIIRKRKIVHEFDDINK